MSLGGTVCPGAKPPFKSCDSRPNGGKGTLTFLVSFRDLYRTSIQMSHLYCCENNIFNYVTFYKGQKDTAPQIEKYSLLPFWYLYHLFHLN